MAHAIPAVGWLPSWRRTFRKDTLAALAVWAVLIPQAMAYAALAGVPPVRGLYAACAGLLLYALLGTSRQLNVGPSSGLAILSAATVAPIAAGSASRYLELTALLALIVGVVLTVAGLARLGFIAEFLAKPVLAGYMVGLALVILVGQLSSLLGISSGSGNFFQLARNVLTNLDSVSGWTVVVGVGSLVLILVLQTVAPRLPAALIVVVAGVIAARAFALSAERSPRRSPMCTCRASASPTSRASSPAPSACRCSPTPSRSLQLARLRPGTVMRSMRTAS
jgi:MFS superfamily sulfate permease-like transporter